MTHPDPSRPQSTRRPKNLHDCPGGQTGPRRAGDARIRKRQSPAGDRPDQGQRVEAPQRAEDGTGWHGFDETRQDLRPLYLFAQPERGLVQGDDREQPDDREPDHGAEEGAPHGVDHSHRGRQEPAESRDERRDHELEEHRAHHRSHEARHREPGRPRSFLEE